MKYHATKYLTGAGEQTYVFRGNSVYDSDAGVGGSQPVNYDDIAGLYNEYCVLGSKISVTFNNASTTQFPKCFVKSDFNTTYNAQTYDPYVQKDCTVKAMSPTPSDGSKIHIKAYRSTSVLFGRPIQYDPNFSSAVNTNPLSQWYWHVGAFFPTPDSSNMNIKAEIVVTYYVVFRKVQSQLIED